MVWKIYRYESNEKTRLELVNADFNSPVNSFNSMFEDAMLSGMISFGAIQIRDTFWPILDTHPHPHPPFNRKRSFLKTFAAFAGKFSTKMDEKMTRDVTF